MYTFDYYFYPKQCDSVFLDEYTSTMDAFLAALISNGQVINGHDHMIFSDNNYIYSFYAPEKDSLNEKYYNTYCRAWLSTVT